MKLIEKIKDIIFKIKDYDRLESDYCTCLCYFTNNKMSKPNYQLESVLTVIGESTTEYIDYGYNYAKEKAEEWIKNNLMQSPYDGTKVITHFTSVQDSMKDFKKFMKRQ